MDILKTISKHGPESLYELAKLVDKNQAYIYRETKILEKLGLVDFIKAESGGRKRVRPQNRYAQIVLHL
jgi:predicted transcriptional regulator